MNINPAEWIRLSVGGRLLQAAEWIGRTLWEDDTDCDCTHCEDKS